MTFKTLTSAALAMIFAASAAMASDPVWYYDEAGDLYYVEDGVRHYDEDRYYDDRRAKKPKDDVVYYYHPYIGTQSVISSGPAGSAVITQSGSGSSAVIAQSTGSTFYGRQPRVSIDSPAGSIRIGSNPAPLWWHW